MRQFDPTEHNHGMSTGHAPSQSVNPGSGFGEKEPCTLSTLEPELSSGESCGHGSKLVFASLGTYMYPALQQSDRLSQMLELTCFLGSVAIDELETLTVSKPAHPTSTPILPVSTSTSSSSSSTPLTAPSQTMTPQLSFDSISTPNTPATLSFTKDDSDSAQQHHELRTTKREELIGGGALWAMQGARIWLQPTACKALVDVGKRASSVGRVGEEEDVPVDLTEDQEAQLENLALGSWEYLEGKGRKMIRARLMYEGDVRR